MLVNLIRSWETKIIALPPSLNHLESSSTYSRRRIWSIEANCSSNSNTCAFIVLLFAIYPPANRFLEKIGKRSVDYTSYFTILCFKNVVDIPNWGDCHLNESKFSVPVPLLNTYWVLALRSRLWPAIRKYFKHKLILSIKQSWDPFANGFGVARWLSLIIPGPSKKNR